MIGFCPLASGSKGNCIYLGTTHTKILLDAGLGVRGTEERLATLGISLGDIEAILVTHEHTDHIRGLSSLACKKGIPVFANSETAKAILSQMEESPKFRIFSTGETFEFGDLEIHPFSIQHDTLDPVAFTIRAEGHKVGFCTDLGCVTTLVTRHLQGCDYLYVEANHQPSMVHACNRPLVYKQRVLGRQGHLSNQECAELIALVAHKDLQHIHLAHLSSECNHPDLALKMIREKLDDIGLQVPVSIAWQDKPSQPILF
ncbi:MAG: MBL fold metallo-hydrolase [Simkania sp.]|nr:MBL fold metallo-hydrolase [Simkania sp.]